MPLRPVLRPLLALANALEREDRTRPVAERGAAAASGPLQMKHMHASVYLTRVLPSAREAMQRTAGALRTAYELS